MNTTPLANFQSNLCYSPSRTMIQSTGPQRLILTSRALLSRVLWLQNLLQGMCGVLNELRPIGINLAGRYLETRRPNTQITYTFFPQTIPASSMIMKPPSYVKNPHPSYYISVNMNCFTPSSYITTIRRDGWEGEVVGDFEYDLDTTVLMV